MLVFTAAHFRSLKLARDKRRPRLLYDSEREHIARTPRHARVSPLQRTLCSSRYSSEVVPQELSSTSSSITFKNVGLERYPTKLADSHTYAFRYDVSRKADFYCVELEESKGAIKLDEFRVVAVLDVKTVSVMDTKFMVEKVLVSKDDPFAPTSPAITEDPLSSATPKTKQPELPKELAVLGRIGEELWVAGAPIAVRICPPRGDFY